MPPVLPVRQASTTWTTTNRLAQIGKRSSKQRFFPNDPSSNFFVTILVVAAAKQVLAHQQVLFAECLCLLASSSAMSNTRPPHVRAQRCSPVDINPDLNIYHVRHRCFLQAPVAFRLSVLGVAHGLADVSKKLFRGL